MTVVAPNVVNMIAPVLITIVLVLAVRQDLANHRISNVLTFGALAAGLLLASLAYGLEGGMSALAGAGVGLACLLPLYLCKGMGAGDVKLMAAAGAFLGPINAFIATFATLAIGAVLAISVVAWRVIELRSATVADGGNGPGFRDALAIAGKDRFPYAAAIAVGVFLTMWARGLLRPLAGVLA